MKKLNEFMSKIASGYKTFLSTGMLTAVSVYASTKGFDVAAIQQWIEAGWLHINNLIITLGALTVWFRKLANRGK